MHHELTLRAAAIGKHVLCAKPMANTAQEFHENCPTSYGAFQDKTLPMHFPKGSVEMPKAFAYRGQRLHVTRRGGDTLGRDPNQPAE